MHFRVVAGEVCNTKGVKQVDRLRLRDRMVNIAVVVMLNIEGPFLWHYLSKIGRVSVASQEPLLWVLIDGHTDSLHQVSMRKVI